MALSPLSVIARGLSVLWTFAAGGMLVEQGPYFAAMSGAELGAICAGLSAPPALLWVLVGNVQQREAIDRRLAEFARGQEELSLQVRLMLNSVQAGGLSTGEVKALGDDSISVIEGEEVSPEFIHRTTQVVDDWLEVEFRNVGGPAHSVMAITEGDTQTRVTNDQVGSWKSVTVSLQTINGIDQPFRFCLSFENERGDEQQQFFRYSGDAVVAISRPTT